MLVGALFKIKENKLNVWKDWEQVLMKNKLEAIETLKEENMLIEGSMTFKIGEDNYAILFGYHEEELKPSTEKEINIIHKRIKSECLEYISKIDAGYFVKQY